jgi:hypothetical protein
MMIRDCPGDASQARSGFVAVETLKVDAYLVILR